MKKIYTLIFMCAALLAGVSCSKQEAPGQDDVKNAFVVDLCDLVIPAKGGEAKVLFSATEKFDIELNKEWCSFVIDADTLRFRAAANEEFNPRYAIATVKVAGKKVVNLTLQQNGFYSGSIDPIALKPISVPAAGKTVNIEYSYSEKMEASTDVDWITVSVSEDFLTLVVAENTTTGTPENPSRQAKVTYAMGIDRGEILVDQKNVSFMHADNNWNVHYDGVQDYEGEDAAYISNDVTDPTLSGKYAISYVTKAEFEESGMEMDDYMMVAADNLKDELEEALAYYQMFYPDMTFADFLYEESDYEIFNPLDEGEYIAIAVGFTDDAKATGHYQFSNFTVQGGSDDPGDPNDISGTWFCASVTDHYGDVYENWEMKITKSGSSFSIAGFDIGFDDFLSQYSLSCQPAKATLSNGVVTVACYSETGIQASGIPVQWVGLEGNSLVDIKFAYDYNKNTLTLTSEAYGAYIDDPDDPGFYSLYDAPVVFKRTSGGGGGGGSTTGYDAFLGEWEIPHGSAGSKNDTWVISKKEEGSTYSITGIEGYSDLSIEAQYDATTSSMVVVAQEEIGTKTLSGAECSVGFYGGLASGSFWRPGSTPYTVFTATISGNTATLTPGTVKTQDGEVNPEIAFYCATTPEGKYSLLKTFADATKIPNTMTRKGEGGGEASDAYKKWLGSWSNDDVTLTFSQKVADQSYSVIGFGDDTDVAEVLFDKTNGGVNFTFQEVGSGTNVTYYIAGISTDEYVTYGDDNDVLAKGTMAADGKSISIKGHSYTTTYNDGTTSDDTVDWFGLFGYGERQDGSTGWMSYSDCSYVYCPATLNSGNKSAKGSSLKPVCKNLSGMSFQKGVSPDVKAVFMTAVPAYTPAKAAVRVNGRVARNARLDSSCSFSSNARVKLIRRVK